MSATADETAEKQPSERRLFNMDFSAKMSTTEVILGTPEATSEDMSGGVSDLTIETPMVVGQTVSMWIKDGSSKHRYRISNV